MPSAPGYVGFSSYLDANKSAAQAQADAARKQAEDAAKGAQDAQSKALGEFSAAASAGSGGAFDPQKMNGTAGGNIGNTGGNAGAMDSSASAAAQALGKPTDQQLRDRADKSYTGPTGLNDVPGAGDLFKQSQDAQAKLDALGSESGVQNMLGLRGGSGMFSAGLIGSAGRGQFAQAQGQYSPNQGAEAASQQADELGQRALKYNQDQQASAEQQLLFRQKSAQDAQDAANAAQGQKDVDAAREGVKSGYGAYSIGGPGSVNTLGTKDQFESALQTGTQFGDMVSWNGSSSVKEQAQAAEKALGMDDPSFRKAVRQMTGREYQDFWLLGVIPQWMQVAGENFGKNKVGGWKSPFLTAVTHYGADGGMWNAVTDMWKNGVADVVTGAAGGIGGEISTGVKYTNKGANPNPGK